MLNMLFVVGEAPDNIPAQIAIPVAIVLWVILVMIVLVSLRRGKVARDKKRRIQMAAKRRESYIAMKNFEEEEAYLASLDSTPVTVHRHHSK